jgi:hypothetical protein
MSIKKIYYSISTNPILKPRKTLLYVHVNNSKYKDPLISGVNSCNLSGSANVAKYGAYNIGDQTIAGVNSFCYDIFDEISGGKSI